MSKKKKTLIKIIEESATETLKKNGHFMAELHYEGVKGNTLLHVYHTIRDKKGKFLRLEHKGSSEQPPRSDNFLGPLMAGFARQAWGWDLPPGLKEILMTPSELDKNES